MKGIKLPFAPAQTTNSKQIITLKHRLQSSNTLLSSHFTPGELFDFCRTEIHLPQTLSSQHHKHEALSLHSGHCCSRWSRSMSYPYSSLRAQSYYMNLLTKNRALLLLTAARRFPSAGGSPTPMVARMFTTQAPLNRPMPSSRPTSPTTSPSPSLPSSRLAVTHSWRGKNKAGRVLRTTASTRSSLLRAGSLLSWTRSRRAGTTSGAKKANPRLALALELVAA